MGEGELVQASELFDGDIIESHDDKVHEIVRTTFNDTKRIVKLRIEKDRNPNDAYECEFDYDHEITVLFY